MRVQNLGFSLGFRVQGFRVQGLGFRAQGVKSKLLKGGYIRDYIEEYIGDIKEDTRSLDHGSYGFMSSVATCIFCGFLRAMSECTTLEFRVWVLGCSG